MAESSGSRLFLDLLDRVEYPDTGVGLRLAKIGSDKKVIAEWGIGSLMPGLYVQKTPSENLYLAVGAVRPGHDYYDNTVGNTLSFGSDLSSSMEDIVLGARLGSQFETAAGYTGRFRTTAGYGQDGPLVVGQAEMRVPLDSEKPYDLTVGTDVAVEGRSARVGGFATIEAKLSDMIKSVATAQIGQSFGSNKNTIMTVSGGIDYRLPSEKLSAVVNACVRRSGNGPSSPGVNIGLYRDVLRKNARIGVYAVADRHGTHFGIGLRQPF